MFRASQRQFSDIVTVDPCLSLVPAEWRKHLNASLVRKMSLHAPGTEFVDMALRGTHSVGGRVSCLRLGTLDVDPVVGLFNFDILGPSPG